MAKTRKTHENMRILGTILQTFSDQGDRCQVETFWDETKEKWIDIVICPDCPTEHVNSYATLALSDFSIGKTNDEIPLGVELLGACHQKWKDFANILSTCAFNIILEGSSCFPGAIFPHMIDIYLPEVTMKHILFVPPFGWKTEFKTLEFDSKYVAWLLAVPISEAEFQYAQANGSQMLQALFQEKQINIYDLNRESVE